MSWGHDYGHFVDVCNMHAIRLNPIGTEAYGSVSALLRTAKGIENLLSTERERKLSAAVQHRIRVWAARAATCVKRTSMSEKAKNTSKFINWRVG
jgi:hypothetical protein